jgi:spore germination protein YaaH
LSHLFLTEANLEKREEKTMMNNATSPEERRLMILKGINQDHSSIEIAAEMGVMKWIVLNDLRAMKYNKDPELKQAYLDKEMRAHAYTLSQINLRDERFRHMTGKTFQEKNFENMVNYYKSELQAIYKSGDERVAISGLSKNVRKTLKHNDITTGHGSREHLSGKARDLLSG